MAAQKTLGEWAPVEHVPGEGLDDDPTPRGVVRSVLEAAMETSDWFGTRRGQAARGRVLRVLDLGAGYGCWSSEMRRLAVEQCWPVHITGVELNPEREEHLRKWCDEVCIRDWRTAIELGRDRACLLEDYIPGADLIIGNPPFAHILRQGKGPEGERTDYMLVDETMVPTLLRHAPAVLLMHTAGAFDDSEHGREVWRRYPPAASWLCGRLSFRPGSSTDSRTYYSTLWLRGHEGPAQLHMLPWLLPEARRWSVPPGSEDPDTARVLGLPMVGGGA
jgi:predicted RNA methylase